MKVIIDNQKTEVKAHLMQSIVWEAYNSFSKEYEQTKDRSRKLWLASLIAETDKLHKWITKIVSESINKGADIMKL